MSEGDRMTVLPFATTWPVLVLDSPNVACLVTGHPTGSCFHDHRSGIAVRVRNPGLALRVQAADPLWLRDSWYRRYLKTRSR